MVAHAFVDLVGVPTSCGIPWVGIAIMVSLSAVAPWLAAAAVVLLIGLVYITAAHRRAKGTLELEHAAQVGNFTGRMCN